MKTVGNTKTICHLCFQEGKINKIDAQLIEDEKKIWMIKRCPIHGTFKEIYFNDVNVYNNWMIHKVTEFPLMRIKTSLFSPSLYESHLSPPVLINLVVTNRRNYLFPKYPLNPIESGHVYEPSLNHLREMMISAKGESRPGSYAIQIMGGEPTLRDDLFDILQISKKIGFAHIQIQTNGITFADNIEYCNRLKEGGMNSIYLEFNGITHETNPLLSLQLKALENLKLANINVVLVSMLGNGKNVQESGKIIRFALNNLDAIRGVHFVPMTFPIPDLYKNENIPNHQRVDFIQFISNIEQEFGGLISRYDFYPIPIIDPLSQLVEMIAREPQVRFVAHPCCGASTFLYLKNGKPLPVTRFMNVETIIKFINQQKKKKGPLRKLRIAGALVRSIDTFIENEKAPEGFDLRRIIKDVVIGGERYAIRGFHNKTLFIGSMWYQDAWNLDIDRLQQCIIHYMTPEGIVPSCIYNGLGYGQKIEQKYSISIEEWEKKTSKQIKNDFLTGAS